MSIIDDFGGGTISNAISGAADFARRGATSAVDFASNQISGLTGNITQTSSQATQTPTSLIPSNLPKTNDTGLTAPSTPIDPYFTEVFNPINPTSSSNAPTNASNFTGKTTSQQEDDFAPNPMSAVDQPSYYWRWYLKEDIGSGSAEITIAETGVTGFNIQEVRFDGLVGPNFKTRNVNAINFQLRIAEPAGMSLPDMLMAAINQLKIRNYMKAPWHLDLELRGRDPNTGQPASLGKLTGARDKWTWKILITELVTNTTEVGGIHTIKAQPYNDLSAINQIAILDSHANIPGKTVGEVLKKVIDAMNKSVVDKYGFPMIIYDIKDIPYKEAMGDVKSPFDHKIEPDKIPENSERNREGASLARGTDISKIVDYLMGQAPSAVKMANPSREFEYKGKHKAEPATLHRIGADVQITDYEWLFNDYVRKVTFTVIPYEMLRIVATPEQVQELNESGGTGSVLDNKYKVARERKYLNKIYEYLWTGRNTEVLRFDINLNFRFAVPFSPALGLFHYGTSTIGRELVERLRTNMKDREATKQQLANIQQARSTGQFNGLKPATISAGSANAAENIQTNPVDPSNYNLGTLEQQTQAQLGTITSAFNTDRITVNQQAEQLRGQVSLKGNTYAEDLDLSAPVTRSPQILTMIADSNNPRVNQEQGTQSQINPRKSVYGTILNQVYTNISDGNLQNIQLEIRGDPYWIGPSNIENISTSSSGQIANFLVGEHLFGLKFGLPSGLDNQQTKPVNDIYSGYYGTVKVENIFSDGVFKQTLHGVRLPAWKFKENGK